MLKIKLTLSLALLLIPVAAKTNPMIELFTSQGCYSCPPADEFLGELLEKNPDVVALEFHVDYWDDLHYGAAGVWKDPFSNPAYSARQRRYNSVDLAGRRGVYTPQMIVNGHTAQVGTSKRAVYKALDKKPPGVEISASVKDNLLAVDVQGEQSRGSVLWLAIFDRIQVTDIPNGENHGKTLTNHHVVRELVPLGQWQGNKISHSFALPANAGITSANGDAASNRGCAVFLQDEALGQVQGATYCDAI